MEFYQITQTKVELLMQIELTLKKYKVEKEVNDTKGLEKYISTLLIPEPSKNALNTLRMSHEAICKLEKGYKHSETISEGEKTDLETNVLVTQNVLLKEEIKNLKNQLGLI